MSNQVQYFQLASNVHLFLNKVERAKVDFNLYFTAGGAFYEKDFERGVTHLLEHCAVARTKSLDFEEFRQFLFKNDIYVNASTSRTYMHFVTSGHKLDQKLMLDLLLEFAFAPTLTEKILEQEKEIVVREIQRKYGDPNFRLSHFVRENIFEENSLYRCETLGDIENVKNATIEIIQEIRKRMMDKSQIIIKAVGDIDIEFLKSKILESIKENKNALPVNYIPENKLIKFNYLPLVSELAHEHAALDILLPFPVNIETSHVRTFFYELMFSHDAGVLYNKLRNELGLIYSLEIDYDYTIQILTLSVTCEISSVKKIVDEVVNAFSNFDAIFNEDKLDVIRNLAVKKQEIIEDNPNSSVDFMSNTYWDYGVLYYPDEYIDKIKNIDINEIRKVYDEVKENLDKKQVLVVSNNKEIEGIYPRN